MLNAEAFKPLYGEASYEIVLSLMEHHPDADRDDVGLPQLVRVDHCPARICRRAILANDALLIEILRAWYEEKTKNYDK